MMNVRFARYVGAPALIVMLVICRPAAADPILVTSGFVGLTPGDFVFSLSGQGFHAEDVSELGPFLNLPPSFVPRIGETVNVSFDAFPAFSIFGGRFHFTIPPVQLVSRPGAFDTQVPGALLRFTFDGHLIDEFGQGQRFDLIGSGRGDVSWASDGVGPFFNLTFEPPTAPVPEPTTVILLTSGMAAIGIRCRRPLVSSASCR